MKDTGGSRHRLYSSIVYDKQGKRLPSYPNSLVPFSIKILSIIYFVPCPLIMSTKKKCNQDSRSLYEVTQAWQDATTSLQIIKRLMSGGAVVSFSLTRYPKYSTNT